MVEQMAARAVLAVLVFLLGMMMCATVNLTLVPALAISLVAVLVVDVAALTTISSRRD